jgi:hypothetical protein
MVTRYSLSWESLRLTWVSQLLVIFIVFAYPAWAIQPPAPDYWSRATTQDCNGFVAYLYKQFLGRSGDQDGIKHWCDQMNSGTLTPAQLVNVFFAAPEFQQSLRDRALTAFSNSAEFQNREEAEIRVALLYAGLWGRAPTPEEIQRDKAEPLFKLINKLLYSDNYKGPSVPIPVGITGEALNKSIPTRCAEQDNVSISMVGHVKSFVIQATHPNYVVQPEYCEVDYSNCPAPKETGYAFQTDRVTLYDDGETALVALRVVRWWRPNGMQVSVDDGDPVSNYHLIQVYRKIKDSNQQPPEFFVLYMDGSVRLIPQPPVGVKLVQSRPCYGSSVIVGPTKDTETRPIAEITSVRYLSKSKILEAHYLSGGSAIFDLSDVDRNRARVRVTVNYSTEVPFATLRSMFVANDNADAAYVMWKDPAGGNYDAPVMSFPSGEGKHWLFHRKDWSHHNTSAPDILIDLE